MFFASLIFVAAHTAYEFFKARKNRQWDFILQIAVVASQSYFGFKSIFLTGSIALSLVLGAVIYVILLTFSSYLAKLLDDMVPKAA